MIEILSPVYVCAIITPELETSNLGLLTWTSEGVTSVNYGRGDNYKALFYPTQNASNKFVTASKDIRAADIHLRIHNTPPFTQCNPKRP